MTVRRFVALVGVATMLSLFALPAVAGQNDPRLPALLERLRATKSSAEAEVLQGAIWRLWTEAGDQTVDQLMVRGVTLMAQELWPLAIATFTEITEVAPEFAEGWNKRATAYFLAGEFAASVADIDHTLALEPRHWGALAGLGQIRLIHGELEAAVAAFTRALDINPHLDEIRALLGDVERVVRRGRDLTGTGAFGRVDGPNRSVLVLCDHARLAIPPELGDLGLSLADRQRHIAWDIGAFDVACRLAERLAAPLLWSAYSRLVADCNRAPDDPGCLPTISDGTLVPANADLTEATRDRRLAAYWRPYHDAIAGHLDAMEAAGATPAVLSIHSFTPEMGGVARPWTVGVLWNRDRRIAGPLLDTLAADPALVVGDNEPYSGTHQSGFTVPHHAETRGLPHMMLEIRQDLIADPDHAAAWGDLLAEALGPILASLPRG